MLPLLRRFATHSDTEAIVHFVARSTQRAVAVTDTRGRMLAYSSHAGPVDEVRRASILSRQTPSESLAWSRKHGIDKGAPHKVSMGGALRPDKD